MKERTHITQYAHTNMCANLSFNHSNQPRDMLCEASDICTKQLTQNPLF